jgi:hypothetical protein
VIAVLLVVVRPDRADHEQQHCYHPEAAVAVDRLPMMGKRMPETC